jgi:hypothetical protein
LHLHLLDQLMESLNHLNILGGLSGNNLFLEDGRLCLGFWVLFQRGELTVDDGQVQLWRQAHAQPVTRSGATAKGRQFCAIPAHVSDIR